MTDEQQGHEPEPEDTPPADPSSGAEPDGAPDHPGPEAGAEPEAAPGSEPSEGHDAEEARRRRAEASPPPRREGRSGQGTRAVDPDQPCMNCGDPTPGEYCPTCGQRKVVVQVSVRTLLMDVLEDQFILDKRLPRTLGTLLFKPGYMTVEHLNGRVVRYIHPFRLFLVTSIVFFLVLSFFSLRLVRTAGLDTGDQGNVAAAADSLGPDLATVDSALAEIDQQLADSTITGVTRATLRATRSTLMQRRRAVTAGSDAVAAADSVVVGDTVVALQDSALAPDSLTLPGDTAADRGPAGSGDDTRTLRQVFDWESSPPEISVAVPAVDSALTNQLDRLGDMTPREAAETLTGTFFNYAPTMMFILLPVFAAVLKLLYIRRRRYYAEHFVFLLHVHSFVFLLATIMLLLGSWVGTWLELLAGLWMLVYIYLAMLRVYGQGWLKTFAKYWTLGWMYFWILTFSIPFAFVAALLLF